MDAVQDLGFCGHEGTGQRAGVSLRMDEALFSSIASPGLAALDAVHRLRLLLFRVWDAMICPVLPVGAL